MRRLLMVFIAVMLLASCASSPRTWDLPPGVKALRVNGYDMAYVERGSGVPLVLVHGALSDYRVFKHQMAALSTRYRVIAVSLRHYYPERWDGNGDDFSIQQHAADVAAFIKALDAGRVHLLGHSRGGNVVLHVAKSNVELLRTLTLADASGLEGLLPKKEGGKAASTGSTEMRAAVRERLKKGDIEGGMEIYFDFAVGPGKWKKVPDAMRRAIGENAWTVAGDIDRPTTTCAEGAKITVPTLIINGQASPSRYPTMAKLFQSCLGKQERVVIPKAGHVMFLVNPKAFNAALLSFLDRH